MAAKSSIFFWKVLKIKYLLQSMFLSTYQFCTYIWIILELVILPVCPYISPIFWIRVRIKSHVGGFHCRFFKFSELFLQLFQNCRLYLSKIVSFTRIWLNIKQAALCYIARVCKYIAAILIFFMAINCSIFPQLKNSLQTLQGK